MLAFIVLLAASLYSLFGQVQPSDTDQLNIHLVPHTHDDLGWLKTVDEYYTGEKNYIQVACVKCILDRVIPILLADPSKRFTYVEMAFFAMWWDKQTDNVKEQVRRLVKEGRLEFANAGWSMNDEGCAHYNAIIDQMTLGHKFLQDTFGPHAVPRTAWQIDPFGHSAEQASLFSQMGFDGLFFARLHFQDKQERERRKALEMVWRGSRNLGRDSELLTSILYYHYCPPPGFCFDSLPSCNNADISNTPASDNWEIEQFLMKSFNQAKHYRTNNILLTMGCDFTFYDAEKFYLNMDKLIEMTEARNSSVRVFYSTPQNYLQHLHQANLIWPFKTDDFFPYADNQDSYWAGYFTSRPALKRMIRYSNNILQICKQLEVFAQPGSLGTTSRALSEAMGVTQHHDSVTGTCRSHVARDYVRMLSAGLHDCHKLIGRALTGPSKDVEKPGVLVLCSHLNVSYCPEVSESKTFSVVIYNPLGRENTHTSRIPVWNKNYIVRDTDGETIPAEFLPFSQETLDLQKRMALSSRKGYDLVFTTNLPALGSATYTIMTKSAKARRKRLLTSKTETNKREDFKREKDHSSDTEIENEHIKIVFSGSTGCLTSITNKASGHTAQVDQTFMWYYPTTVGQREGAYILNFVKQSASTFDKGCKAELTVHRGALVQEVKQVFAPWISQVVRIYPDSHHAELEYTIGPVPLASEDYGRDIITRFDTNLMSGEEFFTDANGREMKTRRRNHYPSFTFASQSPSANYYPVNSRLYIQDKSSKMQFTVLTDRSVGGSSLSTGSLELMLHRRILGDDARGLVQHNALNETDAGGEGLTVRGKMYVILSTIKQSARLHRHLAEQILLAPIYAFQLQQSKNQLLKPLRKATHLINPLPENIHLLTLEKWGNDILLRLEHLFELREDTVLSRAVKISLKNMFKQFEVLEYEELTLAASRPISKNHDIQWSNDIDGKLSPKKGAGPPATKSLEVTLRPMQIRTFRLKVRRRMTEN